MFNKPEHSDLWQKLMRLHSRGQAAEFDALLESRIASLCDHMDDLRVLYYIATNLDMAVFNRCLKHFEHWKHTPPPWFDYRCSVFLYALYHSCPP